MECEDVRVRLIRYADNDLPVADHRAIENHLDHCYLCHEELNEIVAALDACREALQHPNPRNRFEELRTELRPARTELGQAESGAFRARRRMSRLGTLAAAAAAVLILMSVGEPVLRNARHFISLTDRLVESVNAGTPEILPPDPSMPFVLAWQQRVLINQHLAVDLYRPDEIEPAATAGEGHEVKPEAVPAPVSQRESRLAYQEFAQARTTYASEFSKTV